MNSRVKKTDHAHLHELEIESQQVYRGRLLDVRHDCVRLPDGNTATREYVMHQGAVVVIPFRDDGKLVFERQFRYPLRRTFLELPAGKIDPGEDIRLTASRELREETGYAAREWRHLGVMHPCIGYSNERIEIFMARGLQIESGQSLDQGEFLDVLDLTLSEALLAVRSGEITDAKTITALFWAEKVLHCDW